MSPFYELLAVFEGGRILTFCFVNLQEIIFNEYGKVVTIPENIGTKNYGVNPVSIAHVWYDILPYWFWGNSANDRTPWQDRVLGAEKGANIKTFFENLQKNLDNILKQLNFN